MASYTTPKSNEPADRFLWFNTVQCVFVIKSAECGKTEKIQPALVFSNLRLTLIIYF